MLHCNHFVTMHDFHTSEDCFKSVEIKGGVNYFLYDKNLHFKKPMLLTPILADFKDDNTDYKNQYYNHFAYCAGAAYFRVIKMMLGAYKLFVENGGEQKLILIISLQLFPTIKGMREDNMTSSKIEEKYWKRNFEIKLVFI